MIKVSEKICSKCGELKPASEFGLDKKNTSTGLSSQCKRCVADNAADYRRRNPEKVKESKKRYDSSEKGKAKNKEWEINNPDKLKSKKDRYRSSDKGKETEREYRRTYEKIRTENDEVFRSKEQIRKLILQSFRKNGYGKETLTCLILGKEWSDFKFDIEHQFDDEMNWDNHGEYWNYDHIIPVKYAMTADEVQWLNYYTNFQPMEKYENQVLKNDNVFYDLEALQKSLDAWGVKLNIE